MDEKLKQSALDYMRRRFAMTQVEGEQFVSPFAFLRRADGGVSVVEMPDSDDRQQRHILQERCAVEQATAVVVVQENWAASATEPADQELIAMLRLAGRLQDAPAHLLREEIKVFYEDVESDISIESATITGKGVQRVLGEFEPLVVHLPRPGFKRYLAERH